MSAAPLFPSVIPLFATPFGVVPLPEASKLNAALAQQFRARAAAKPRGASGGSTARCYVSPDDLAEWGRNDPAVTLLINEMLRGVVSVLSGVSELKAEQMAGLSVQVRGWYTIVRPDGNVPAAHYPQTAWCALYCVAAPDPSTTRADSGVLRLYESRLTTMFSDATNSPMRMPFTTGHASWRPIPGSLAVFPAALTHEIALLRSAGELVLVTLRVRFVGAGQEGHASW